LGRVIGIDLGTTNSCVAALEQGQPLVIPSRGGQKIMPSIVAFTGDGKRLVGHAAKRQAVTNSMHTVYAAKRLIGRKFESAAIQRMRERVPYPIVEGPHDDVRIELRGQVYSVAEISAFILSEMRRVAEDHFGSSCSEAVITVPAYFNDGQRQATKDAGNIAGLDVLRIINEPTAAVLAYGFGKDVERRVAVFDLGGGTFDISILEIGQSVFEVVATAGDTFLGGEDFDLRIIDWLVEGFRDEHGVDLREEPMALQRVKEAAERSKCELSTVNETEIHLPFLLGAEGGQALHLQRTLARAQLEELTADLVDRTLEIVVRTMDEAGMSKDHIEDVLLVGGQTRMPLVQERVADHFGRPASKGVHPDEAVAVGAAIHGANLVSQTLDMLLLDVTPHSLGIMIHGGYFSKIIPKNTTVPTSASHVFTTVQDDQVQVRISVMQGESDHAEDNELLGEFVLGDLRPAPRGEVEILVNFEISADGIVGVSAKDLVTGQQQSVKVTASSGLTRDELEEMAERHGGADGLAEVENPEVQALRNQIRDLAQQVEAELPRVREVLAASALGDDVLAKSTDILAQAGDVVEQGDRPSLEETRTSLERVRSMFQGILARG